MVEMSAGVTEQRAKSALEASPVCGVHDLNVELVDDRLLINGLVSSFYHKQLAQEIVRAVASQVEVVNSIRVR